MRTKHFIIIFMALLLPSLALAQSATMKIFQKYSDHDGFDSIILSGELFKMLSNDKGEVDISGTTINTKEFNISKIKSIKILNINENNVDEKITKAFIKDVNDAFALDKGKYKELMKIRSGREQINVIALVDKSKIQEVIIYRKNTGDNEATLIYFEGPFEEEIANKLIKELTK